VGPTAFLIGGALLVVCLAVIVTAQMVLSEPPLRILVLVMISFLLSVLAIFVGLFGLYPRLRSRAPRLAFADAVSSGIAAGALVTIVVGYLSAYLIYGPAEIDRLLHARGLGYHLERIVFHLFYLGFPVAFLSFGAASWRTWSDSRLVAGLLLLAGALLLMNLAYEFSIWVFGMGRISDWIWVVSFGFVRLC
jgi:hypothetical protein